VIGVRSSWLTRWTSSVRMRAWRASSDFELGDALQGPIELAVELRIGRRRIRAGRLGCRGCGGDGPSPLWVSADRNSGPGVVSWATPSVRRSARRFFGAGRKALDGIPNQPARRIAMRALGPDAHQSGTERAGDARPPWPAAPLLSEAPDADRETTRRRIAALSDELRRHDALYYQQDAPEISDRDYDLMRRELERLEAEHGPTSSCPTRRAQRVGAVPADGFATAAHRSPMLSLDNAMNADEMRAFDARVRKLLDDGEEVEYVAEPKLDGSGIELIYESGRFVQGLTRGDGQTGEDVTVNLRRVGSIPERLATDRPPKVASVRGEIVLPLAGFERLNEKRTRAGLRPFENPRNAAAGSLRQIHDVDLERLASLEFRAYALAEGRPEAIERQSESPRSAARLGLRRQPGGGTGARGERGHRLPRAPARRARPPPDRDRRHRLQGGPPRRAGPSSAPSPARRAGRSPSSSRPSRRRRCSRTSNTRSAGRAR
jgi:hypothetical protein